MQVFFIKDVLIRVSIVEEPSNPEDNSYVSLIMNDPHRCIMVH